MFRWSIRTFLAGAFMLGIFKFRKKRQQREGFNLDAISTEDAKKWFRFEEHQLRELRVALRIPDVVITDARDRATGTEALCILLRRFVYPNRLFEAGKLLGRSDASISRIFNHVLMHVYDEHKHLLEGIRGPWMAANTFAEFAAAARRKGAPLETCIGFVDGTMRFTCRPKRNQKAAYSGHKRAHGLKYQAIIFPNGIIGHLYGPLEGCRHDAGMLRESKLLDALRLACNIPNGGNYCIYGDPAYPISPYLLSPFKAARLSANQCAWNKRMSRTRQSVEWGFGNVAKKWAFVDFKKNQKIYLQAVGAQYAVAVILTNCHNCLKPNQTSKFFACKPPGLFEYLAG